MGFPFEEAKASLEVGRHRSRWPPQTVGRFRSQRGLHGCHGGLRPDQTRHLFFWVRFLPGAWLGRAAGVDGDDRTAAEPAEFAECDDGHPGVYT